MEKDEYRVPRDRVSTEIVVKKSRFIADVFHVETRPSAMECVNTTKAEYPDARHHCWAYLIGAPQQPKMVAFSDDGEPSGTAGKPILNVMQHKDVGDLLVVVTRYFGGVKLGASGLIRSYSSATQHVYEQLHTRQKKVLEAVSIRANYAFEQPLRHWLLTHSGEMLTVSYENDVVFSVSVEPALKSSLRTFVSASGCHLVE